VGNKIGKSMCRLLRFDTDPKSSGKQNEMWGISVGHDTRICGV
jgi:hypothetical protein